MPLTPADVHNVAFKKPPIGKRGYDEEEVDAFLDLIEVELAKLIEENTQLRAGIAPAAPADSGDAEAGAASQADGAAVAELEQHNHDLARQVQDLEAQIAASQDELEGARQAVAQAQQEAQQAREAAAAAQQAAQEAAQQAAQEAAQQAAAQPAQAEPAPMVDHSHAVKVLALAQQTADQHLAEAAAEAQRTVAEARTAVEQLTAETKAATEAQISEAQQRADQLDRESKARANNTIQEAEQRRVGIVTQLEQQRDALERRLEELRTFEREYRTRLKSYLEAQLRDLDASGSAEEEAENAQR
jgi:DivIVA domain-containing protein